MIDVPVPRLSALAALLVLAACSGNNRSSDPKHTGSGSGTGTASGTGWGVVDENPVLAPAPPLPAPPPGLPPLPDAEPVTPEQVAFGELLFFEPRLSAGGKLSCATCHDPDHDWSGAGRQPTASGAMNLRRAPNLSNLAWRKDLGWDGRYPKLDGFLLVHVKGQLGADPAAVATSLGAVPLYRAHIQRAFGAGADGGRVLAALAAFVRTRYTAPAPWDTLEAAKRRPGQPEPDEVLGYKVFTGRAQCGVCHPPQLYTDVGYHRLGLIAVPDDGRGKLDPGARGAFRTPSLRGAAARTSFFHDGSAASLAAAIDWHVAGGTGQGAAKSIIDLPAIKLTPSERAQLGAFVTALTAPAAKPYPRPILPP